MKPIFTKTYITTTFLLFFYLNIFATNVTVMESQSFHPDQTMDIKWQNVAIDLGYSVNVENYPFLDDPCNLTNTDILVLSSGLIELSPLQKEVVEKFVSFGGQVYIQGEYLFTHPGSKLFKHLVTELGGDFNWEGQSTGQQVPMYTSGPIKNSYNTVNQLNYFWYGIYGSGDSHIKPFLNRLGKDYGFIFDSNDNPTFGKIVITSDQDWIRNNSNIFLMENILKYLEEKVTILPFPEVSITSTAEESCAGEVVTFNAEVLNYHPGVALQWMINGQLVPGQINAQFSSSDLQDGDVVECVLQLDQLCGSYLHVSNPILMAIVIPISIPILEIFSVQEEYCKAEMASFLSSTSDLNGLDVNLQWLLNGLAIPGETNSILNITTLENMDIVSLNLSYSTACSGDITVNAEEIQVAILDMVQPTAILNADLIEACEGAPITFTVEGTHLGTDPVYQWLVDGVPYASNNSELVLNNLNNDQEVSVIVTSSAICASFTQINVDPIAVTIFPNLNPSANIIADKTTICAGEEAHFVATGDHLGQTPNYEWSVDGIVSGTNEPEFFSSNLEDGASVRCMISVSGNCLSTNLLTPDPVKMQVNELTTPNIEIDADKERACEGASVTFTATGEHWGLAPVFQWSLNGEIVAEDNNSFEISEYHAGDILKVQLVSNELCAIIDTLLVAAAPIEVAQIDLELVEAGEEHCGQKDGFIEILATGGFSSLNYEWNNGSTTDYLDGIGAGVYGLIVSDDFGCTAQLETKITQQAAPLIMDIVTTPALCEEATGTAQVITTNDQDYLYHWISPDGSINSNNEIDATLPAGLFSVEVEDAYGCKTTGSFEIERYSPIQVDLGADIAIRLGESIELNPFVNEPGEMTYEWTSSAPATPCGNCKELNFQPTADATYNVVATNEFGCTATDEVLVKVLPNEDYFVPNAFSPDGDGSNDYFTIYGGSNLENVVRMQIFDRWGSVIFEQTGMSPNADLEGWDGFSKGKLMDKGVYVYVVELEFLDGKRTLISGDVSIF